MKSIVKTAAALSMLLTFTGCWDFGWSKKHKEHEKSEVAHHGQADDKAAKACPHKGCTQNHKHHDEVKTQGMDDDDNNDDNDDVRTQGMDDDDNDDSSY